jgi:hypothetical protein
MQRCFRNWAITELQKILQTGIGPAEATLDVGKKKINLYFATWCDTAWASVPETRTLNGLQKIGTEFHIYFLLIVNKNDFYCK